MIRIILIFLAFIVPFSSLGQNEVLYYFSNKDSSLIGVKTTRGTVIIPLLYKSLDHTPGEKVTGNEIHLVDNSGARDSMGYDYGYKVFDRRGNFLYSPYWFDNGPDYYLEGLRRFVENGKMGFADRNGKKVIPAKYNYIDPFYRGYALACLDCKYTRFNNDEEHCCGYAGSKYTIIDRTCKIVYSFEHKGSVDLTDSILNSLGLLHPHSAKEKSLIQVLERLPEVSEYIKEHKAEYCTVVAERPKGKRGYYLIVFRDTDSFFDHTGFLISHNGKSIFHMTSAGDIESLSNWRKDR